MTQTGSKPNVLLIAVDHLSALLTRPGGNRLVMTPTLSQFAQCGVNFTNAYSACPVCVPARRTLMTGLTTRGHGDRTFQEKLPMPPVPTMAQCFRDAGYQAFAVGKLHVYPQRDRIGFDDAILNEEGRRHLGMPGDDWEQYLAEQGFAGQEYGSGLNNNDYMTRTWQLPEHCHQVNWTAREMCRVIHRRDPRKPGFWYLSFSGPHPPLWPLQTYMDQYRDVEIDKPLIGSWLRDPLPFPAAQRNLDQSIVGAPEHELLLTRRAFYATVTHIDHQIRTVLGALREAGIVKNTIIAFMGDHGDMLGDHGMWAKRLFYDMAAKVPLLIVPAEGDARLKTNTTDDRLAELRDVMPTLLDMAGLPIPGHVEGQSLLAGARREYLYGEDSENENATRMIRGHRYKLIYYAAGNRIQLFDMIDDPREMTDLAADPRLSAQVQQLSALLIRELYGSDLAFVKDGKLVGLPDKPPAPGSRLRAFTGQRGYRFL